MARRNATSTVKTTKKKPCKVMCCDCIHSYDYHELDCNGKPFLCHCDAKGDWGKKFSDFLYNKQECKKFEQIPI